MNYGKLSPLNNSFVEVTKPMVEELGKQMAYLGQDQLELLPCSSSLQKEACQKTIKQLHCLSMLSSEIQQHFFNILLVTIK
jgi:hypothetical protein